MKTAKTLCYIVLVGCVLLLILSLKFKAVWDFGNSAAGWWATCIVALVVGLVALRDINKSR
jgi:hypothetical protein